MDVVLSANIQAGLISTLKQLFSIDLLHDDVIRPQGSMVVVGTLKSKMAVGSTGTGGNNETTGSMII